MGEKEHRSVRMIERMRTCNFALCSWFGRFASFEDSAWGRQRVGKQVQTFGAVERRTFLKVALK
jgi:hypothetical protein